MLIACLVPVLTFAVYALFCASVFHHRVIKRPIVFMTASFVPFLITQSIVLWFCLRNPMPPSTADDPAVLVVTYGLPCLIAALLGVAYLQFYCLMEFSISLRMLDEFLADPRRELTFQALREAYPLEEVLARKCEAAGEVGLLRARRVDQGVVLDMSMRGIRIIRFIERLKAFLNWNDAG